MQRFTAKTRAGFSLMELMLVIVIIGILMGMVGAAAYGARQRAYRTQAAVEVQQIATAFKAFYLANHRWPGDWADGQGWTPVTKSSIAELIGGTGDVYLDISDFRFDTVEEGEGKEAFLDPWGQPYEVQTDRIIQTDTPDTFEGAVCFPNFARHYYEEAVYDPDAEAEDRPWQQNWPVDR